MPRHSDFISKANHRDFLLWIDIWSLNKCRLSGLVVGIRIDLAAVRRTSDIIDAAPFKFKPLQYAFELIGFTHEFTHTEHADLGHLWNSVTIVELSQPGGRIEQFSTGAEKPIVSDRRLIISGQLFECLVYCRLDIGTSDEREKFAGNRFYSRHWLEYVRYRWVHPQIAVAPDR